MINKIAQCRILDIPQKPVPVQMFPPCEMLAFLAGRTELKIKSLDLRSLGASFGNDIVALPRQAALRLIIDWRQFSGMKQAGTKGPLNSIVVLLIMSSLYIH